jgi:phage-related baseplate assembly protein
MLSLRAPAGLPDPTLQPPTVAESGDPFASLRVVHLLARIPRGRPVPVRDVVDRLNAEYVDWSFSRPVVVDAIVQLQANWMADYRSSAGIVLDEGPTGATVTIEESSRVDPWIVRQAERLAALCTERLRAFAVEEGSIP